MSHALATTFATGITKSINVRCFVEAPMGVGEESQELLKFRGEVLEHFFVPVSRQRTNTRVKFLMLKFEWEAETAVLSSTNEMAMHPAYQKIIGMGRAAVPLILSEMQKEPGHWFWALKAITGEDPTSPADRGRVREMTESWLRWGREQGLIE